MQLASGKHVVTLVHTISCIPVDQCCCQVDVRAAAEDTGTACGLLFSYIGFSGVVSLWQMRKLFQDATGTNAWLVNCNKCVLFIGDKGCEALTLQQFEHFVELLRGVCDKIVQVHQQLDCTLIVL